MLTENEKAILAPCVRMVREWRARVWAARFDYKYPGERRAMRAELSSTLTEARDAVAFLAPLSVRTCGTREYRDA